MIGQNSFRLMKPRLKMDVTERHACYTELKKSRMKPVLKIKCRERKTRCFRAYFVVILKGQLCSRERTRAVLVALLIDYILCL
jgi:hypothetical protein